MKMLVIWFVVVLSSVQLAVSIRCYECNSYNNSMCVDPSLYDPDTLNNFLRTTECRQGVEAVAPEGNYEFFCRKIVQTILHKHADSQVRVTRGCGWKRHYRDCYKADNEDHLETVCQCFTDNCNGATRGQVRLGILLAFVVLCFVGNKLLKT